MTYDEPRLVAIYDVDNPDGPDHDFFRTKAIEFGSLHICDLGCGTGLLTVTLAGPGRTVTGIDPSAAMLEVARHRDGGQAVCWIQGTAAVIEPGTAPGCWTATDRQIERMSYRGMNLPTRTAHRGSRVE